MNKLVKNTTIYAIGDIIPRLLSFISFPILTTYLTPSEYGILSYANTVNLFVTAIGFLCLNTYYLVYFNRLKSEEEQKKLLGNLTVFIVGFNLIFSLSLFIIGPIAFGFLESNINFYPYIAITLLTCFFNIFSVLPSALFRLKENPLPLTIIVILRGIFSLAFTLIFVIFFEFKAEGILYSNLIVSIIFAIVFIYITNKNMILNFNLSQIKDALLFSLPLLPGTISYYLISMSDRIFIDKYLSLKALGIYSTASTLALLLNIVISGSYRAIEPHFFKIYGSSNFNANFISIRNVFFAVIICSALALALFSKEFYIIFSNQQYYDSYLYVPLILIGLIFSSLSMLYGTVITANRKTKINSGITICGGLISVCLNVLFLPRIGLVGACISSSFTMLLILISSMHYSRLPKDKYLLTILLIFFVAVVISFLFVYYYQISNIFTSITIKTIVLVIFMCICKKTFSINIRRLW